jgi:5'-deoxynucleotidase YfbR-like HD superfamily hydrolase
MLSGRRLNLLDPSPLDIEIEDIAHGLARVARWNGQTVGDHIFSVAQHALLVEALAGLLNPHLQSSWRCVILLHDAPEYVVGDLISPFKTTLGAVYKDVELLILKAIHERFSLPEKIPEKLKRLTKRMDRMSAALEAHALAGFSKHEAEHCFGPFLTFETSEHEKLIQHYLTPWCVTEAHQRFLERFFALSPALYNPQTRSALSQVGQP